MNKLNSTLLCIVVALLGYLIYRVSYLPDELLDTFFRPMGYHELTPRKEFETRDVVALLEHNNSEVFISFSITLHFETEASIFGADHFTLDYYPKIEALRILEKMNYEVLQTTAGQKQLANSLLKNLKTIETFKKYKVFKVSFSTFIFSD